MKILHLRASNFYGGPERQLHFHARYAKENGLSLTVSSFSEKGQTPEFLNVIANDNIPTYTFEVDSAFDKKVITSLKDYLVKNKIDILCTHDYKTHAIGWRATRNCSTKWIAFSRGWTAESMKIKLYHALDKTIVRLADHLVAVSDAQKRKLENILISSAKITTVHNAIDPIAFSNVDIVDLKQKFKLPDNAVIGISGGRFSNEKGQVDFVNAAKIVLSKFDHLYFILFGDGPDLEPIRESIKQAELENKIICPGFEKNLIGCIKGADFLVNPSHSEGLPNIVLEAMAMKVFCIATDVGGVGEIMKNKYNGFLVPAKIPPALAEVISKYASGAFDNEWIIANGYKTIIEKFSFQSQYDKLVTLYQQIIR